MSYCGVNDVVHEFTAPLRRNMERDYGEAFEEVITGHIRKAEDFVNASLARAYSVPLKKAASIVVTAECKLAAFYAVAAYSEKEDVLRDKYETAVLMLDNLVEADNPALVDECLSADKLNASGVLYYSDEQRYTPELLEEW